MDVIAQLISKGLHDHAEGVAAIVGHQILHVLKQEGRWLFRFDDPRDVEEECALCRAFEAVRSSEGVFLAHTGNAEWLAWEAREKDVVIGHIRRFDGNDVTDELMIVTMIGEIGLLGEVVPLAGEDAPPAMRLEPQPNSANASEQVNHPKARIVGRKGLMRLQDFAQGCFEHRWTGDLPLLPTTDRLRILANQIGDLLLRKAFSRLPQHIKGFGLTHLELFAGNFSGHYVRFYSHASHLFSLCAQ